MSTISLADGRTLDVETSGPEDGFPLLFHHGTPGSIRQFRGIQRAAHDRGLRLITYSRAGYGSSTRNPGRDAAAITADVEAIANHLSLDRFVTAGWSGGGPHALALGAQLSNRVLGAVVMAGVAPYDADDLDFLGGMGEQNLDEFELAIAGEGALRPILERDAPELREADAAGIIESLSTLLPDVDRTVLSAEFGEDMALNMGEALRTGVDGWCDDSLLFARPWGFDVAEVAIPTFIWQGSEDLMVPFSHGEWLASHVPGTKAHLLQGEGHLSVIVGQIGPMLDELLTVLPD